jgi:hypothetical protein
LHQFAAGALPVVGYLADWQPPVWVAIALSVLTLVSERLSVAALLARRMKHGCEQEDLGPLRSLVRLDEALRVILLAAGLVLLWNESRLGWLAVLAGATVSLLQSTTVFSFTLLPYAGMDAVLRWLHLKAQPPPEAKSDAGNPNCLFCRTLRSAPYGRCRWCRLTDVRRCCGLQTSILMVLLLVIAFLLTSQQEPIVAKLLVTLSIMGLVALSLAISRQTDDLLGSLNHVDEVQRRTQERCEFLKRLSLADSVRATAETVVAYTSAALGAGRVSVMVLEDGMLRIAASRGIPEKVVARVAVPVPEHLCGHVFASGRPVVLDEESVEPPLELLGLKVPGTLASYPLICAPLATAARRVGVVNLTDRPGGPLSEADFAELQFIAEASAISLCSQIDRREIERGNYAAIRTLALTIDAKDPYTHGHSQRVQTWAIDMAKELGLPGPRLQTLTQAAELHDIGKLAIPDEVLKASRGLTSEEWALIRQHPRRGAQMVQHLTFLRAACEAILHHHERLDGTGYPDGLAGDGIPLEARILAVADAYDAMTSARPYRPALTHEEAIVELRRCAGTQLDPQCVEAFIRRVGEPVVTIAAETPTPP